MSDIAVRVLTRVIGHYPDREQVLIDCGWTGLSHDSLGKLKTGFCYFEGHPKLKYMDFVCAIDNSFLNSLCYSSGNSSSKKHNRKIAFITLPCRCRLQGRGEVVILFVLCHADQ